MYIARKIDVGQMIHLDVYTDSELRVSEKCLKFKFYTEKFNINHSVASLYA